MNKSNFWRQWNDIPLWIIAGAVVFFAYYQVLNLFGWEAGLYPPGYYTSIPAGVFVGFTATMTATIFCELSFPSINRRIFNRDEWREALRPGSLTFKPHFTCVAIYSFFCGFFAACILSGM